MFKRVPSEASNAMSLRFLGQTTRVHDSNFLTLPKFSRAQFAEFARQCSTKLPDNLLYQAGFGAPGVYQIFLRPGASRLFKSKTTAANAIPTWARSLQAALPLRSNQIFELARAREAFQFIFSDPEDPQRSLTLTRDGLLETSLSMEEIAPVEKELKPFLDERYRVRHNIKPLPVSSGYVSSYFSLRPDPSASELILRFVTRLENRRATYYVRRATGQILMTLDELRVAQNVLEQLHDLGYRQAKFWVEGQRSDPPANSIARSKRLPSLYLVRDSLESLIELLEETRLFSTSLGRPYRFVPAPDGVVRLTGSTGKRNVVLDDRIFDQLGEFCYDSRTLLDLSRIWRQLYPGDLPP
jgi:hypothetical protein